MTLFAIRAPYGRQSSWRSGSGQAVPVIIHETLNASHPGMANSRLTQAQPCAGLDEVVVPIRAAHCRCLGRVSLRKGLCVSEVAIPKSDLPTSTEKPTLTFFTGGCDEGVPVNRYFDEQRFGQFVEIVTGSGIPLIASRRASNARSRLDDAGFRDVPLDWQLYGGIPFDDALAGREAAWQALRQPETTVVDLDGLIATGAVSELQETPLRLTSRQIRELLDGNVVTTNLPGRGVHVALQAAEGDWRRKLPEAVTVPDLAAFLANPSVLDNRGRPIRLTLSTDNVRELRTAGRTSVTDAAGSTEIRLTESWGPVTGSASVGVREVTSVAGSWDQATLTASMEAAESEQSSTTSAPIVPRLGIYLPWRQRWVLDGYARGRLLYTTPLAPREEVTIEVFTWDRLRRSLDQTTESDIEQTFESTDTTRDVTDIMNEATKGSDLQARAEASFDYSAYGATISLSGGVSVGQKLNSLARTSTNNLHENVSKAAARVKTRRTSRIVESRESGREERTTRRLTNTSECHGLTIQYFEIVAAYQLVTEHLREDVRPVVLVANPLRTLKFDNKTIRQYEASLRAALFDAGLAGGFDAVRLTAARAYARGLVCEDLPCDEKATKSGVKTEDSLDTTQLSAAIERLRTAWRTMKLATYKGVFEAMDDQHRHELEPTAEEMRSFRIWVTYRMLLQTNGAVAAALEKLPANTVPPNASADTIRTLAAGLVAELPQGGLEATIATMDARVDAKRTIARSHVFDYSGNPSAEANWWNDRIEQLGLLALDDAGLTAAVSSFLGAWDDTFGATALSPAATAAVEKAKAEAERMSARDRLEAGFALRDSAMALEREEALTLHLNENANYYRHAVFVARPVAEQLVELAKLGVSIEMIEPRVIGSIGDSLVLPVSTAWEHYPTLDKQLETWLKDVSPIEPLSEEVTLATPGLLMQTLVDDGCACGPEMRRRQDIETETLELARDRQRSELQLVEAEAARYRKRLDRDRLDDPDRASDPLEGND